MPERGQVNTTRQTDPHRQALIARPFSGWRCPLQVQRQQKPQDRLAIGVGWGFGPAVGGLDGAVEGLVGPAERSVGAALN